MNPDHAYFEFMANFNQVKIKKGMKDWHEELQRAMDEAYG